MKRQGGGGHQSWLVPWGWGWSRRVVPGNKRRVREQWKVAKFELQKCVQSGLWKPAVLEADTRSWGGTYECLAIGERKWKGSSESEYQTKQANYSGRVYVTLVNLFLDSWGFFKVPGKRLTENVVYLVYLVLFIFIWFYPKGNISFRA